MKSVSSQEVADQDQAGFQGYELVCNELCSGFCSEKRENTASHKLCIYCDIAHGHDLSDMGFCL